MEALFHFFVLFPLHGVELPERAAEEPAGAAGGAAWDFGWVGWFGWWVVRWVGGGMFTCNTLRTGEEEGLGGGPDDDVEHLRFGWLFGV